MQCQIVYESAGASESTQVVLSARLYDCTVYQVEL